MKTVLTAKGLSPNERRGLVLEVSDFTRTNRVLTLNGEIAADAKGEWTGEYLLPSERYGIYYVRVRAGDLALPKVGTGPKGYFTYAVIEDPAKMPDLDPWDAFLGEHSARYRWLWQRGGLGSALKPSTNRLVIVNTHRACGEHKMGGKLFWDMGTNEQARAQYRTNLTDYVMKAIAAGPGRQGRCIYENLWEPNLRAPRLVTHDGKAWHYVFSLPWACVNLNAPEPGTAFRMAFQYNDREPDDRALHQFECFRMKLSAPKHFGWFVVGK